MSIYRITFCCLHHVNCYLSSSCLVAHRALIYRGLPLFSVCCNDPRVLLWSPPCLFTFLFNCSSPCCHGYSSSPFSLWSPAYCNFTIVVATLPQDATNRIPSTCTMLHFLAQQCHTRSFQQLLSSDMILIRRIFRRHLRVFYSFVISFVPFSIPAPPVSYTVSTLFLQDAFGMPHILQSDECTGSSVLQVFQTTSFLTHFRSQVCELINVLDNYLFHWLQSCLGFLH